MKEESRRLKIVFLSFCESVVSLRSLTISLSNRNLICFLGCLLSQGSDIWSYRISNYISILVLQAIYKHYHNNGNLTLQEFIILFGVFELFLSQFPDIHSLRWVNSICTFDAARFVATTIGLCLYDGTHCYP